MHVFRSFYQVNETAIYHPPSDILLTFFFFHSTGVKTIISIRQTYLQTFLPCLQLNFHFLNEFEWKFIQIISVWNVLF